MNTIPIAHTVDIQYQYLFIQDIRSWGIVTFTDICMINMSNNHELKKNMWHLIASTEEY